LVVTLAIIVAIAPLAVVGAGTTLPRTPLARTVPAALVGTTLAWTIPAALVRTALSRATLIGATLTLAGTTLIRTTLIGPTLIRTTLVGTALALTLAGAATAALVLVAAIPAAVAATVATATAIVATAATFRLRALSLGRRRGLLGLRRLLRLTPVGTVAAVTARSVTARLTPAAAVLRLRLRLLLRLLLAPVATAASAIQTILPRAGGFGRGAAQQRQDHGGRNQTFHFQVLQETLVLAPSLIPCRQCRPCRMNRV
jgi:hypothetical protein